MFVVGSTPLSSTAARSFVIVVKILLECNAHQKNGTNQTLGSSARHNFSHIFDHPQIVVHTFHHSTHTNFPLESPHFTSFPPTCMTPPYCYPLCCHSREHRTPDLEHGRHRFLIEAMIQRRHHDVSMGVSTKSMRVFGLSLVTTRPPMGRTVSLGQSRAYKSLMATTSTKHRNGVFACLQRGISGFNLSRVVDQSV